MYKTVPEFRRLTQDDPDLPRTLEVLREGFAGMEGRIDPPSSLDGMTVANLAQVAAEAEVWVAGQPVVGTVTLTPKGQVLYVGKLAVAGAAKATGLGRALMALAEARAAELGFGWLELQSRVELVEVHAVFKALGFHEVMRTTHEGYLRPTSVTFRKKME